MIANRVSPRDVAAACRAAAYLSLFWIRVRTQDVRRLQPGVRHADRSGGGIPPQRLMSIVRRVARIHPLRPRCLEQAFTVAALAARSGRAVTVRIGARRVAGRVDAHAWAEVDGVVLDPAALEYATLISLDGAGNAKS